MEQREKNTPATRMDAGFSSVPETGTRWNRRNKPPASSSASSPENYHRTIIKTLGEKNPTEPESCGVGLFVGFVVCACLAIMRVCVGE